jgi:hypothetical protein
MEKQTKSRETKSGILFHNNNSDSSPDNQLEDEILKGFQKWCKTQPYHFYPTKWTKEDETIIRLTIKQSQVGMIKIEDVEKMIDEIKNPYPTDIFPELTIEQLREIDSLIQLKLYLPLDRLSASLMRRARNNLKDELKQSLKELGEK